LIKTFGADESGKIATKVFRYAAADDAFRHS